MILGWGDDDDDFSPLGGVFSITTREHIERTTPAPGKTYLETVLGRLRPEEADAIRESVMEHVRPQIEELQAENARLQRDLALTIGARDHAIERWQAAVGRDGVLAAEREEISAWCATIDTPAGPASTGGTNDAG